MPDGSDNIAKEKSSMIIGTVWDGESEPDTQFANAIPEQATSVVFTDEVAPEGTATTDLTVAKDGDVVGWLDGTTWKVSTQNPNKAVTFNENCVEMFVAWDEDGNNKLSRLTHIAFDNVDTSNVTNMKKIFGKCANLTSLDLSNFNTSKVTDMSYMFWQCQKLTKLNLSSFDTSKVTNMEGMFSACSNLTSLDLSNFDTSKVTDMVLMFNGCKSLSSLDLSSFDTSNVTDMTWMFDSCTKLATLNLSSFNTSKVKDMQAIFYECKNLTSLDLSSFNTANTTNIAYMFDHCQNLATIYVGKEWSIAKVQGNSVHYAGEDMFEGCVKLPNYDSTLSGKNHLKKAHTGPGGYLILKA